MTRPLEIVLGPHIRQATRYFVQSFPRAYHAYYGDLKECRANLGAYFAVIDQKAPDICRMTAAAINAYMNKYVIYGKSPDEFKVIYFLGVAIGTHLKEAGLLDIAKVNYFAMIGLLDDRLRELGFSKPKLTKAMTRLIRDDVLFDELGPTGCYLIYKCVSTSRDTL